MEADISILLKTGHFYFALTSNRFQFMKAGIGDHDCIDPCRVGREDRVREAQEVPEELRLWGIGSQNSSDCRT